MLALSLCLVMQRSSHSEAEQAAWQWNRILRTACIRHPWKNGNEPHTGGVGKYSTAGRPAEFNKWKLFLHLDSTGCQVFSVAAWQSISAPDIWQSKCFPVSWFSPQPLAVLVRAITGFSGFCLVFTFDLRAGGYFQTIATDSWWRLSPSQTRITNSSHLLQVL